jgi:hypothetical protein
MHLTILKYWRVNMAEIVLKINDDISFDRVITLLAPYITAAEIKNPIGKVWTGKAEWLDNPVKMDSFTPLTREEANAR